MTITEVLETQNMASPCKVEYTYEVLPGRQEPNPITGSAMGVNSLVVSSTEQVCYQPIVGWTFVLSILIIFSIITFLVFRWFNPKLK